MSTKDLKAYGASYTKFQNVAKKTATNYYAPKLSSLKKDFSAQVTERSEGTEKTYDHDWRKCDEWICIRNVIQEKESEQGKPDTGK